MVFGVIIKAKELILWPRFLSLPEARPAGAQALRPGIRDFGLQRFPPPNAVVSRFFAAFSPPRPASFKAGNCPDF
jgi:hypothetical protein